MRFLSRLVAPLVALTAACAAQPADATSTSEQRASEQDAIDGAAVTFTSAFDTQVTGAPSVGSGLRIDYALDRLPECRGAFNSGAPAWDITGFYSENGGAAKTFAVTDLSPDGKSRVPKPARLEPSQAGDLAIWFQATNRWGCVAYDSNLNKNYHLTVRAGAPAPTITFTKDGTVAQTGALRAGGKVVVRYEQDRLPQCRRTVQGNPGWTIAGFSQLDREAVRPFETARAEGATKKEIDALVDLPHAGTLSLWFQVTSLGGCMQYDSKGGANYTFDVR
jgi:hypothetical protein